LANATLLEDTITTYPVAILEQAAHQAVPLIIVTAFTTTVDQKELEMPVPVEKCIGAGNNVAESKMLEAIFGKRT
jgi:hypothetical protein